MITIREGYEVMLSVRDGYELTSIIRLDYGERAGNYSIAVRRYLTLPNGARLAIFGNAIEPFDRLAEAFPLAYNDCDAAYERIKRHIEEGGAVRPATRRINPTIELDLDLSDLDI